MKMGAKVRTSGDYGHRHHQNQEMGGKQQEKIDINQYWKSSMMALYDRSHDHRSQGSYDYINSAYQNNNSDIISSNVRNNDNMYSSAPNAFHIHSLGSPRIKDKQQSNITPSHINTSNPNIATSSISTNSVLNANNTSHQQVQNGKTSNFTSGQKELLERFFEGAATPVKEIKNGANKKTDEVKEVRRQRRVKSDAVENYFRTQSPNHMGSSGGGGIINGINHHCTKNINNNNINNNNYWKPCSTPTKSVIDKRDSTNVGDDVFRKKGAVSKFIKGCKKALCLTPTHLPIDHEDYMVALPST